MPCYHHCWWGKKSNCWSIWLLKMKGEVPDPFCFLKQRNIYIWPWFNKRRGGFSLTLLCISCWSTTSLAKSVQTCLLVKKRCRPSQLFTCSIVGVRFLGLNVFWTEFFCREPLSPFQLLHFSPKKAFWGLKEVSTYVNIFQELGAFLLFFKYCFLLALFSFWSTVAAVRKIDTSA